MESHLEEILQRLTRIETKLDNGIASSIRKTEAWIDGHPHPCPLERRHNMFVVPVTVAILTAVALKALDMVFAGAKL
jgi:hypothetical protein